MDHAVRISAVIRYIESHIREEIDDQDMEQAVALSYRQIRDEVKRHMKRPFKEYVRARKMAYAAFEMETTEKTLLSIAAEYGFEAYDTFTRAFRREVGMTPQAYRKRGCHRVRHGLIGLGAYGPVIDGNQSETMPIESDDLILYGLPALAYQTGKCTPLPACLESVLTYIGQREHCDYTWLMAATGIGFRLCWNPGMWDMGNCDVRNLAFDYPWEIYERTFRAAGWTAKTLTREAACREEFLEDIAESLAKGRPVIALGVVGPPEACVVTGCRTGEGRLWGRSFFQENPELAAGVQIEASGYFATEAWWENPATTAVFLLDQEMVPFTIGEAVARIYKVLTAKAFGPYRAGQMAYQSWREDLLRDEDFDEKSITPILLSRFFCQADGETMVGEGRYWGARFFRQLGRERVDLSNLCHKAADFFTEIWDLVRQMTALRQGEDQTEAAILRLCDPQVRTGLAALVERAGFLECRAIKVIEEILSKL